jgi:hypothetical protein
MMGKFTVRLEKSNLHVKGLWHPLQKITGREDHIRRTPTFNPHMVITDLVRLFGDVLHPKETTVIASWTECVQDVLGDVDESESTMSQTVHAITMRGMPSHQS